MAQLHVHASAAQYVNFNALRNPRGGRGGSRGGAEEGRGETEGAPRGGRGWAEGGGAEAFAYLDFALNPPLAVDLSLLAGRSRLQ